MKDLDELDCKIFIESERPLSEIAALLARASGGTLRGGPGGETIQAALGEIEVRRNPEASGQPGHLFPAGFLHFRYLAELYPSPEVPPGERASLVAAVLDLLWSSGLAAVAACDYEADLPH